MSSKIAKQKKVPVTAPTVQEGEFKIVPVAEIDPSPFNYRKVFPIKKMEELAASIALHGIIENLTVRPMLSGRYELVAGERRFRAAKMAGLIDVPAIIKILIDEQVREIQLTENLQREDPHPLEEAQAIGQLQTTHKTIDEIALRLGKSKAFVYSRLKLLSLTPDIQEMFVAEKFTLREVLEIAALSPESQQEFYDEYCSDWQEEDFEAPELSDVLDRFKYDLSQAPFNVKDKTLLPDMGACTKCAFNTATLKTLFPDEAIEAICTNTGCYQRKCQAHFSNGLLAALQEHQPAALLFYGSRFSTVEKAIEGLPEAASLPQFNYHGITKVREPELPDQADYTLETETDDGQEASEPDTEAFKVAMEEYKADREEYNRLVENGTVLKGLLVTERKTEVILFSPDSPRQHTTVPPTVTAADVQAAIKAGTATPELLQAEVNRITEREKRSKELDREKVQETVHAAVLEQATGDTETMTLTEADQTTVRLLLLQTLDYSTKSVVMEKLFPGLFKLFTTEKVELYEALSHLSEGQYSYLIRMALAAKAESKFPTSDTGYFLYQMATSAGVDMATIEKEQQRKAEARQKNQAEKIKDLEKKIKKLRPAA